MLAISQKPCLNRSDDDRETELRRRGGEQSWSKPRGTLSVTVQVEQNDPRTESGGVVIGGKSTDQVRLAAFPVDSAGITACVFDQSPDDGIIGKPLDGGGDHALDTTYPENNVS